MQLLGKEQGYAIGLFITASPPFQLPAFGGSGWPFAAVWAFQFSRFVAVNPVAFLNLIVGFLFLIRTMSGCVVRRHSFLCDRLTKLQDAPSHRKLMRRRDVFKSQVINLFGSLGIVPTTEHDTLGDWSTSPFESLGTVPTTEHDTLGNWSTSLLI